MKPSDITFDAACSALQTALQGDTRAQILSDLAKSKKLESALLRLRDGMRSHNFKYGTEQLALDKIVRRFDNRTREDGFNVLHDWDGKADKPNKEIIPVDVLNYFMSAGSIEAAPRKLLGILLDYYLLYIVSLLSLRVWDEGDPNKNLDRLTGLVRDLQGPAGSGQTFVANAEILLFIATSHYEPDDKAYQRLLQKIRTLDDAHQMTMALIHAGILASHLRYGFGSFYKRDIVVMRNDNGADYPWLCFALATLMRAYARMLEQKIQGLEREKAVEGILNGLTPDARAFLGKPPASLAACEAERSEFCALFLKHKDDLFQEFERHRPAETYSPISFEFNFPHNVLKAVVVNALLWGDTTSVPLNELLTAIPGDAELDRSREAFARALMRYALASPERIHGRDVPAIAYDPSAGLRAFVKTISLIREYTS